MTTTQNTPDNADYNPNEFNDADFEDLSLFAGIQSEAEEARQEQADRENRAPIMTLDAGSYWLRIYPEIRLEEDGSRRMHVMRKFWSYSGLVKGLRRLPAPRGEADRIRPEVQRLVDANYGEAWKFKAKEEGLIKVHIYRSTLPKDHKYVKIGAPMFLILRRKQINALNDFLAELSPENLRSILNPRAPAPMIKLSYTAGAGGSSSFGFDINNAELPPLPENFPSLFDVLITDDTPLPTDEEIAKVRKAVSVALAMSSNIVNPEDDSGAAPVSATAAERRAAARDAAQAALREQAGKGEPNLGTTAQAAPAAAPVPAESGPEPEPECPSQEKHFGEHDPEHFDCITCPHEDVCAKATHGAV